MGGAGSRWEGYEKQLLSDTTLQSYYVPNSEEEGCSPIIRNPVAKDGFLGFLKKSEVMNRKKDNNNNNNNNKKEEGGEGDKKEDKNDKENKDNKEEDDEEFDTGYKLYEHAIKNNGKSEFLGYRPYIDEKDISKRGDYEWITYEDFHKYVVALGSGLQSLGLDEKVCIGIFASNRPEWYAMHMANWSQSFKTTALYDTLGPEAVAYILRHSETPLVLCEKSKLKDLFEAIKTCKKQEEEKGNEEEPKDENEKEKEEKDKEDEEENGELKLNLKYIIQIDFDKRYNNKHENVNEEDKKKAEDLGVKLIGLSELYAKGENKTDTKLPSKEDVAYIMYTSGTTGNPKGVMLPHRAFAAMCATAYRVVKFTPEDVHLSYLPMAHIFESFAQQVFVSAGAKMAFFQGDIRGLAQDWKDIRPTILIGVPRVFDKTYAKFRSRTQHFGKLKKWFVEKAEDSSRSEIRRGNRSKFYDSMVWSKVPEEIGFDRVRVVLSAGSALPPHLHEFLKILLPNAIIFQGYGMTENCAGCLLTKPDNELPNHCGIPLDNTEVRLIDAKECQYTVKDQPCPRGEIVMRGLTVMSGYLKNPKKTNETIDKDGWLHTGDIGRINPNGTISIVDRRKNMFKTSHGEYIASEKLEGIYGKCSTISQIFIYGNQYKSFIVAVVVPNPPAIEEVLKKEGIWNKSVQHGTDEYASYFSEIASKHHDIIKSVIMKDMKAQEGDLKPFEHVKDIFLECKVDKLMQGFNVENDCLTPTSKLKRPQIMRKYIKEIKQLYEDNGEPPKEEEHWL